ncbi:DUF1127 domain-containing protein [Ruegeria sp. R13_0]|jgi:uncharacterized protein YjiS (DUF1127 family)|uniref:DUF1127 domain-containing protein n=1 Tax=Ruegeria sp. R13_0 TaxID=2821099 RepID=UPI0035302192
MHLLHSSIDVAGYCAFAAFAYFHPQADADTGQQGKNERNGKMAMATNTTALKGTHFGGITTMIEAAKTRFARYRLYRQTVAELSALSDRELADLGLSRAMIRGLARQAANDFTAR